MPRQLQNNIAFQDAEKYKIVTNNGPSWGPKLNQVSSKCDQKAIKVGCAPSCIQEMQGGTMGQGPHYPLAKMTMAKLSGSNILWASGPAIFWCTIVFSLFWVAMLFGCCLVGCCSSSSSSFASSIFLLLLLLFWLLPLGVRGVVLP